MKKAYSVLALVVAVVGLSACQKKDDSSSATNRAATPAVTTVVGNGYNAVESQYKGELKELSNYGDMREAVVQLMAPNFSADYIGDVQSVQFKIFIDATNGSVNMANTTLFIKITDDYVGQTDQTGNVIEPIRLGMKAVSGTVGANTYSIVFSDGARQVTVSNIHGTVKFKTNQMPSEMLLGNFSY